jgi:hypothetical protein
MECGTLDRSPGGPARRRCGAEALRPPQHASPRRRAKSGDSYFREPVYAMHVASTRATCVAASSAPNNDLDSR